MIMQIGIIGIGNIGKSLIERLSDKYKVSASDIEQGECKGVKIVADNAKVAGNSDIILLAVKPQHISNVLDSIREKAKDKLVITFAAGLKLDSYDIDARLIRVMPTIAMKTRESMSTYMLGSKCTEEDKKAVEEILGHLGKTLQVTDESLLDVITGLSGSGIAYFIRIIDEFIKTGKARGIEDPKEIVLQTVKGAIALMEKEESDELIRTIASEGGTTELGLKELEEKELSKILHGVIDKTIDRCNSIGENSRGDNL